MNSEFSLPWYKHRFVWFVVAIPFSAVVMGVIMIWLAVSSDDGLVTDDYYKKGLAINRSLERDASAVEKKVSANIEMDSGQGIVKLIFDKGDLDIYPEVLQLKLQFATHASNDVQVALLHGQTNQYIGYIKKPLPEGKWYFELSDGSWRLNAHAILKSGASFRLEL